MSKFANKNGLLIDHDPNNNTVNGWCRFDVAADGLNIDSTCQPTLTWAETTRLWYWLGTQLATHYGAASPATLFADLCVELAAALHATYQAEIDEAKERLGSDFVEGENNISELLKRVHVATGWSVGGDN